MDRLSSTVLPSIHDMFPDHLMGLPIHPPSFRHPASSSRSHHDRHCSDSRLHLPHPHSAGHPYPLVNRSNHARSSRSSSCQSSDGEDDDIGGVIGERKHTCDLCGKRFNRPSSLRIHMNTHTGATPFKCPFPDCGRSFNVNSNMRRHYRNHRGAATKSDPPPEPERYAHRPDAEYDHAYGHGHGRGYEPGRGRSYAPAREHNVLRREEYEREYENYRRSHSLARAPSPPPRLSLPLPRSHLSPSAFDGRVHATGESRPAPGWRTATWDASR